ncbi:hypothetical protein [Polaribacter sp.]|uniref:hypothetical protein n=1 Tax=Polaribacter sp. TaxID=1920175 RepID=UPI003F6CDEFF
MKKTQKLLFLALVCLITGLQAQEGRSIANVQLGIGGKNEGFDIKTPAIYGSYEYFPWDNLSIGGLIGYSTLNIKIENSFGNDIDNDTSNFVVGGLMNYYFYQDEKFEFYSHLTMGYASGLTAGFLYEIGAGGRYKLSDALYLNSEIGIGLSLLKVGVTFQL